MSNVRTARPRKSVADKPSPVGLNLDILEREGVVPPLFAFVSAGRRFEMRDPFDLSADEVQSLLTAGGDLPTAFTVLMGADEADEFLPAVPLWKLTAVIEAWYGHYGIDVAALAGIAGNAGGSPTSS